MNFFREENKLQEEAELGSSETAVSACGLVQIIAAAGYGSVVIGQSLGVARMTVHNCW